MSRVLIVNPFAIGVNERELAAVQAALPTGTETVLTQARGDATDIAVEWSPRAGGGLGRASVRHDSPFGTISCEWAREGGRMTVELRIPVGVTAEVVLPDGTDHLETIGAGAHRFEFTHRAPDEDPARPRRWNIHNPEERAQMILEGSR